MDDDKLQFVFKPIGRVARNESDHFVKWNDEESTCEVEIYKEFAEGLCGISEYSHILIFFVFDKSAEKVLKLHPEEDETIPEVGVFATNSNLRPTPLGMTLVELIETNGNILKVKGLEAFNNTPILDIKPYCGFDEEKLKYKIPEWLKKLWDAEK